MTHETIIHVSISGNPTENEVREVRNALGKHLEDVPQSGKIIVSTDEMELHELPALDDYTDELADKIAERIND